METMNAAIGPVHRAIMAGLLLPFVAMCLVFVSIGLAGAWFAGKEWAKTLQTYRWLDVSCHVISNVAREYRPARSARSVPQLEVHFSYEYGGSSFTATQWVSSGSGPIEQIQKLYEVGQDNMCYVNPSAPNQAILHHSSAWFGIFVLPFLAFAALGGIGAFLFGRGSLSIVRGSHSCPTPGLG